MALDDIKDGLVFQLSLCRSEATRRGKQQGMIDDLPDDLLPARSTSKGSLLALLNDSRDAWRKFYGVAAQVRDDLSQVSREDFDEALQTCIDEQRVALHDGYVFLLS